MPTLVVYTCAALAEIAGCFAFWSWLRSGSYCQIWCMRKKLGGFPAELSLVYSVDELDAINDIGELFEAA